MPNLDRYRPDDRRGIDTLYRRVFGDDAAAASRLRWSWQYERNPHNPTKTPLIWVVREGTSIVGHHATMPVRVVIRGQEVAGAWGTDAMVSPERQRQGLGELLFRTWDRNVGVVLGLGMSEASRQLMRKLHWPEDHIVPRLVKPLSRRAFRRARWSTSVNRLVSAVVTEPLVKLLGRAGPPAAHVERVDRFGPAFTELWDRVAPRFDLAVRRDAAYLNWKFRDAPHVRYTIAGVRHSHAIDAWGVYRHIREPRGRVTKLVDLLADPDDETSLRALFQWVEAEARAQDSDKLRLYATHAGIRRIARRAGFLPVRSALTVAVKVNAIDVPPDFYSGVDRWHVTAGDSDQDG